MADIEGIPMFWDFKPPKSGFNLDVHFDWDANTTPHLHTPFMHVALQNFIAMKCQINHKRSCHWHWDQSETCTWPKPWGSSFHWKSQQMLPKTKAKLFCSAASFFHQKYLNYTLTSPILLKSKQFIHLHRKSKDRVNKVTALMIDNTEIRYIRCKALI